MKTYQTTPCTIMSKSDALDMLYDLRDVLETEQEESEDGAIFLPDSLEKKSIINAISSLLYWENRRKNKEGQKCSR